MLHACLASCVPAFLSLTYSLSVPTRIPLKSLTSSRVSAISESLSDKENHLLRHSKSPRNSPWPPCPVVLLPGPCRPPSTAWQAPPPPAPDAWAVLHAWLCSCWFPCLECLLQLLSVSCIFQSACHLLQEVVPSPDLSEPLFSHLSIGHFLYCFVVFS